MQQQAGINLGVSDLLGILDKRVELIGRLTVVEKEIEAIVTVERLKFQNMQGDLDNLKEALVMSEKKSNQQHKVTDIKIKVALMGLLLLAAYVAQGAQSDISEVLFNIVKIIFL